MLLKCRAPQNLKTYSHTTEYMCFCPGDVTTLRSHIHCILDLWSAEFKSLPIIAEIVQKYDNTACIESLFMVLSFL